MLFRKVEEDGGECKIALVDNVFYTFLLIAFPYFPCVNGRDYQANAENDG